jgi:hypothetical protein
MALDDLPDMSAVGNAARASKRVTAGGGKELQRFEVRRGDNGGVIVCETYENKPPPGRRASAAYPTRGDYLENPFSPGATDEARTHIEGLLGQMTGGAAPARPAAPPGLTAPTPRPAGIAPPRVAAGIAGPGGAAGIVRGPAGAVGRAAPIPPPDTGY